MREKKTNCAKLRESDRLLLLTQRGEAANGARQQERHEFTLLPTILPISQVAPGVSAQAAAPANVLAGVA